MADIKNGYIGIDLGTTNSCIATSYYTSNGAVQTDMLEFSQRCASNEIKMDRILPSYIYVQQDGRFLIGIGAKEEDEKMRSMSGAQESRAMRVFKRDMGKDNVEYKIGAQTFTPVSASKMILEECGKVYNQYRRNRDRIKFSDTPTTITCPACFEKDAREDTQRAAKEAGFDLDNVRMLAEPNAALLYYIYRETSRGFLNLSQKKRFVTVDLGGGTCDVVIIDVHEETLPDGKRNLVFRPIGTPNRGDLGGADFDKLVARAFLIWFLKENRIQIDNESTEFRRLVNLLFSWAEKVKINLSRSFEYAVQNHPEHDLTEEEFFNETVTSLDPYTIHIDNLYQGHSFDYEITLAEYLEITERLIYKTVEHYETVEQALASKNLEEIIEETRKRCNCEKEDIDYVFFTGGMSLFLPLHYHLFKLLGKRVETPDDPLTAVAQGAALYTLYKEAELINKELPRITNEEYHQATVAERAIRNNDQEVRMPTAIGKTYMIEKKDRLPFVLIEKNKEYPLPRTRIESPFKTTTERGAIINIFLGESQFDSKLQRVRSASLTFPEPKPIGTPFTIEYEINDSGSPVFYIIFGENEEYKIGGVE